MKGTQKISKENLLLKLRDFTWDVYVFMVQNPAIRKIQQHNLGTGFCICVI